MAVADTLYLLFIARLLSGLTGATYATAAAYLADTSPPNQRSKNFGYIGAAFGIGFILGPIIGGLLGELNTRLPFVIAGLLTLLNALFGFLILPESLPSKKRRKFEIRRCNPFSALFKLRHLSIIGGLSLVLFIHTVANNVYAVVWSFYGIAQFGWGKTMIGISLSLYGIYAVFVQGVLLGKILKKIGEHKTALLGLTVSALSLFGLSVVDSSFLLFVGMPIMALGAITGPTLQGVISNQVAENEQGELQGIFASIFAISAIISPVIMTYVFKEFTRDNGLLYLPGAPFAAAAILSIVALIVYLKVYKSTKNHNKQGFRQAQVK